MDPVLFFSLFDRIYPSEMVFIKQGKPWLTYSVSIMLRGHSSEEDFTGQARFFGFNFAFSVP